MSFIVKGIDIPTDGEITVTIESNGDAYPRTIGASREHYQAMQIPKGHGRLIDADYIKALYYEFSPAEEDAPEGVMAEVTELFDMRALDEAPTILEAEEE